MLAITGTAALVLAVFFGAFGMLAGAIVYAFSFAWLNENVISVWKLGRVTLSEVSGLPPIVLFFALAVMATALFGVIERGRR